MAFHSQRFKAFLGRFSVARYSLSPRTSPSSLVSFFSTNKPRSFSSTVLEEEDLPIEIATNSTRVFDESELLQELFELLPVRYKNSSSNSSVPYPLEKPTQIDAGADDFLPVEDKLRGVFLQKLKGKAAIENALTASITKDLELTVDTVGKVVNRGNLGGEAMDAFFTWAVKQPTVPIDLSTYHVILKALGRRKFFDLMLDKLHDMHAKGICPNCETLEIVIDSLVRASRIAKAIDLFEKLEDFGMECGTGCFNVLLQCLCRRRHVGKANSLLNSKREKIEFDSMTYNIVIGGWSKMGRVTEMEKSLKAMVEDGFTADCLTYRYLIEGLGRASQIDNAVRIFKRIENEGCTLDTGVYNAMINNCISVGDFDECMRYYEQMLRLNCLPNNDTYVKLIGAFLKAQKVSDALEMFDAMLHRGIVPTSAGECGACCGGVFAQRFLPK
ncbi:hypothetical protein Nepgr_017300 [Nepenthes gracilis]|uniref:Pentatricopeptide repeat-containing protein n=1 Tax=Nepenthes gracilis TaxID=150966 RepID=A0AAD3SRD9_NEPGR|nr:hypothetical protein Nepgr_017300 [Nepenthes gracilis]